MLGEVGRVGGVGRSGGAGGRRAVFDLNPAAGRYAIGDTLYGALTDVPGLTFARTSATSAFSLTDSWTPVAGGAPAITSRGLRVQPARTNLVARSNDFTTAGWQKIAGGSGLAPVVTGDAATAPDGSLTADSIVFDLVDNPGGDNYSLIYRDVAVAVAPSARSLWLRSATPVQIAVHRATGNGTYQVVDVDSTWRRFSEVATPIGGTISFQFGLRSGNGSGVAATIEAWGAQYETGAAASADIETAGETVERDADLIELDLPDAVQSLIVEWGSGSSTLIQRADLADPAVFVFGGDSGRPWVNDYVRRVRGLA